MRLPASGGVSRIRTERSDRAIETAMTKRSNGNPRIVIAGWRYRESLTFAIRVILEIERRGQACERACR